VCQGAWRRAASCRSKSRRRAWFGSSAEPFAPRIREQPFTVHVHHRRDPTKKAGRRVEGLLTLGRRVWLSRKCRHN
jgi:hypothetical protein